MSILLHPYVVGNGASLDLPIITENLHEESLAELEVDDDDSARFTLSFPPSQEARSRRTVKAYSQDNLIDDGTEPFVVLAGPSTSEPLPPPCLPNNNEFINNENNPRNFPNLLSLHHSLILSEIATLCPDNNYAFNRCIQKSHSTQSFCQTSDELTLESEIKEALKHSMSLGSRIGDTDDDIAVHENFDTNIQHNDRYPEANDVDSLDNEIMDALTLETGNLPDLTEEQSSSIDESTRRDDFWSETLSVENLNYLNRILCLDQDGTEGQSLEAEWEASGESCEHLHLVLKYWHFLVLPFPELRQAVSWGQVRCYCNNCQPDAQPPLAGNY